MTEQERSDWKTKADKQWEEEILPGLLEWGKSPAVAEKLDPITDNPEFLDTLAIPASHSLAHLVQINSLVGLSIMQGASSKDKAQMVTEFISSMRTGMVIGIYMWEKAQGRIPQKGEENARQ